MAHHSSFNGTSSYHSSPMSTSSARSGFVAAASATATTAATTATTATAATARTFSIFQEGAGQPLVYSPPMGTPELQTLVDQFIALNVPVEMKMEIIRHDFEAHTQQTNERYKTYVVAVPAPVVPAPVAAAPSASVPARQSSLHLSAFPTPASSSVSPQPTWMVAASPAEAQTLSFHTQRPQSQQARQSTRADRSMQIVTRTGEDITHLSSRSTRTQEERESTRIIRQQGACSSCRRKKTRCDPSHMGTTLAPNAANALSTAGSRSARSNRNSRATPYVAPMLSGRDRAAALAAEAASAERAAEARRAEKQPESAATETAETRGTAAVAMTPGFLFPSVESFASESGRSSSDLAFMPSSDEALLASFSWDQLATQAESFGLDVASSASQSNQSLSVMSAASAYASASSSFHTYDYASSSSSGPSTHADALYSSCLVPQIPMMISSLRGQATETTNDTTTTTGEEDLLLEEILSELPELSNFSTPFLRQPPDGLTVRPPLSAVSSLSGDDVTSTESNSSGQGLEGDVTVLDEAAGESENLIGGGEERDHVRDRVRRIAQPAGLGVSSGGVVQGGLQGGLLGVGSRSCTSVVTRPSGIAEGLPVETCGTLSSESSLLSEAVYLYTGLAALAASLLPTILPVLLSSSSTQNRNWSRAVSSLHMADHSPREMESGSLVACQ